MASSNLVKITFIPETTYGETPAVGDFYTARFTSESLSGTPETTESQQLRSDRLSSGQVNTGLNVGGALNVEFTKESAIDLFIESAMNSSWSSVAAVNVDIDIVVAARTLTRASGDWNSDIKIGDVIELGGFSNSENNVPVMISKINSAVEAEYVGPDTMVDESGSSTSYQRYDKIEIGVTQKSFSIQKQFTDLNQKAIVYKGMIVDTMSISVAYGQIVTGSFGFLGNYKEDLEASGDFIDNARTILPAGTGTSLNGSIDMPFLLTDDGTVIGPATFCVQSLEINLGNNNTARTCIGKAAPEGYSLGTAVPEVNQTSYLADENWSSLAKKLTQESVAFGFQIKNDSGSYAVFMPAVQLSGDDPSSGGQNQDIQLSLSGVAKVGDSGEKSLVFYKSPTP